MNIHHVLFFCFLSALCGGNTGVIGAKLNIYTGAKGGRGPIECRLSLPGGNKFFCKNKCETEDILIKTDGVSAQSGRFSIKYRNESSTRGILSVTITNLTKSDEGQYRCGLGTSLLPVSYSDYEVRVADAALFHGHNNFIRTDTEGETISRGCSSGDHRRWKFFCKDECKKQEDILIETEENTAQSGRYSIEYRPGSIYGLYVTITQVNRSDTGWYRCGYGRALSPDSSLEFPIFVTDAPVPSASTPPPPQSSSSSSGSSPPSLIIRESNEQLTATVVSHVHHHGYFLPLVACVSLAGVLLLVVFLLLLYIRKTRRSFSSDSGNMEFPVIYSKLDPASSREESSRN